FEKDSVNKALGDYSKAIEIDPNYADAYNNRGLVYTEMKNYDSALADFNNAIEANDHLHNAFNNRGKLLVEVEDYPAAILDFNKAIELNDKFTTAYLNKGIAHFYMNNIEKACSNWQISSIQGSTYANELLKEFCK
ncbi:MAG: tetratricopeptide repeat protein, partial [Bacteroidales bacterium]|nr:tetratricopeptide repeat protein [Bacteroidales bacterium]